jgi:alcohol dehydrogenase (cytochrome c)
LLALLSVLPAPASAADWRDVTDDRLLNADSDGTNWLMYNRTYSGWRYSPLEQITSANVKKLVPKWIFAGGTLGDQQMTPVVNDGVMFTTSTSQMLNRVRAVNAATGALLWKHDRRIPEDVGALVRIIPHNRGVALYKDKVIFGTLDSYLVALDAKTGKQAWETKIADYADGYFVSAAPMIAKGKVIIGISGPGEMGPRGFVEAFDANGTPAAANLRAFKGTEDDFLRIVRNGRAGTAMTPWKGLIDDDEIRNVARYIKKL